MIPDDVFYSDFCNHILIPCFINVHAVSLHCSTGSIKLIPNYDKSPCLAYAKVTVRKENERQGLITK